MLTSPLKKASLIVLLGLLSQAVLADDASATRTIAGVLVDLNHFPSDDEKAQLMAISRDQSVSPALRTVAQAAHDIQHAAPADAQAALNEVINSESAPAEARALAEIILGINHMPGDAAKARLNAML